MNEAYGDNDWQLADLLNCLRIEIEAREKCAPGKKEFKRVNPGYPTAGALTTGSSKATCTFCKGAHNTSECHVVTDIRQRKNILKREGRCYLCLRRSGHWHVTVKHQSNVSVAKDVTMLHSVKIGKCLAKSQIIKAEEKEIDLQISKEDRQNRLLKPAALSHQHHFVA